MFKSNDTALSQSLPKRKLNNLSPERTKRRGEGFIITLIRVGLVGSHLIKNPMKFHCLITEFPIK